MGERLSLESARLVKDPLDCQKVTIRFRQTSKKFAKLVKG